MLCLVLHAGKRTPPPMNAFHLQCCLSQLPRLYQLRTHAGSRISLHLCEVSLPLRIMYPLPVYNSVSSAHTHAYMRTVGESKTCGAGRIDVEGERWMKSSGRLHDKLRRCCMAPVSPPLCFGLSLRHRSGVVCR